MPRKKHLPRAGSRITKRAAADVGPVIDQLIKSGQGTPERLVEEASDPSSPAHPHFEWDDAAAAYEHRLAQARQFFRFIVTVEPATKEPMRAYLHVSDEAGRRYEGRAKVKRSVPLMTQVLGEALDELECWQRQYAQLRDLAELSGIWPAVDKALQQRRK
jgi:hypothetical protein